MNAVTPFAELPIAGEGVALIAWPRDGVDPNDYAVASIHAPCLLADALAATTIDLTRPVLVRMVQSGHPPMFYARDEWATTIVMPGARIAAMDLPMGKDGSRIFAMLAVIVAASFLGPEVAGLLGFTGDALVVAGQVATTLIAAGLNAVVSALLPPPGAGQLKQEQPSPTYSLNAQGNYARLGQAVEEQIGLHIHYPSLLALYKEYQGDDEFLYMALGLGEGEFEILEWGWANTAAWRAEPYNLLGRHSWAAAAGVTIDDSDQALGLSEWEVRLAGAGTCMASAASRAWPSGAPVTVSFIAWVLGSSSPQTLTASLYNVPGVTHDFAIGATPELFSWTFTSSDAAMAAAVARFAATLSAGVEIRLKDILWHKADYVAPFIERPPNETYGYTNAFPGVQHEIVPPGGAPTLIVDAVYAQQAVGGQVLLGTNESGAGWIGPFPTNPPNTRAVALAIDFFFSRGLYKQNNDGSYSNATVTVEVQVRPVDDAGIPTGAGTWTSLTTESFTEKSGPKIVRRTVLCSAPTGGTGRFEARAKRTNAKSTDSTVFDECIWAGLKAYFSPTASTGSETWMMVSARANDQLQGSAAQKLYVKKIRKLPAWTGAAWSSPRMTRSPAWALAHVHRTVWPQGEIDTDTLVSLAHTWHLRGDCADGIFDGAQSAWDVEKAIARTGRARPILPGGALSVVRDEPREILATTLLPSNTLPNSTSLDYVIASSDLADALIVEYFDERTWRTATVECVLPGVTPSNRKRIRMPYVVRRAQAWREGMFGLAENAYRRIFATTETEAEGLMLWPGHRALLGHDAVNWGDGAVVAAFDGRRVVMDRPLEWAAGETHKLALQRRNGRTWGPVTVTAESASVAILPDPLPGGLEDPATVCVSRAAAGGRIEPCRAAFGWGSQFAKKMIVLGSTPRSGDKARLSLVIDDPRVYPLGDGLPPPPAGPPAAPAAEDLSFTYSVSVSGSGFSTESTYIITAKSAAIRAFDYYQAVEVVYRAPNLSSWVVRGLPGDGGAVRAIGRFGRTEWSTWTPPGGGGGGEL